MKFSLKSFLNFFNPYSESNLDSEIKIYLEDAKKYNLDISHLSNLENSISKTSDSKKRLQLKVKFKNSLRAIYDQHEYDSMSETIDRAW
ncbi:hypothetical protein BA768_01145 [Chryseobacterium sp. CBo1]|uniref:hypothetical protein n=1 Tax=Chryseobacterium sp. CBo1 TaxID=1869230 RepID=UPI00081047A3|nr:hypothetical protein [Chryseobacterium sp. CBo1]OCK53190.1 hypothetical protein BA768_01145 [Chryseobacterium sp. CBo1]